MKHIPSPTFMKKIVTIVPSRGRPDNILKLSELFFENSVESDLFVVIDQDEHEKYPRLPKVNYKILPQMHLNEKLNYTAMSLVNTYEHIAFFGDDVEPKTKGWDRTLLIPLVDRIGISYGNDLLQGHNLPNNVVISSKIIKELGFMAPPQLKHFYIDNFWKELGLAIQSIYYNNSVILEHMHPLNNKAEVDSTYNTGWSNLSDDEFNFTEYMKNNFNNDVNKIIRLLNNSML